MGAGIRVSVRAEEVFLVRGGGGRGVAVGERARVGVCEEGGGAGGVGGAVGGGVEGYAGEYEEVGVGACQVVLDVDCFQRVGGCVCEWEGGREEKEVREGRFGR